MHLTVVVGYDDACYPEQDPAFHSHVCELRYKCILIKKNIAETGCTGLAGLSLRSQEIYLNVFAYQQKASDAQVTESGVRHHTLGRW